MISHVGTTIDRGSAARASGLSRLLGWVAVSAFVRQGTMLLVHFVLFERLSRSAYGTVALGFGYLSVFAGFGEMGIRQIGWREVARDSGRVVPLTSSMLSAKTAASAVAILVYLALTPWLWESGTSAALVLLFGAAIALNGGTFEFPLHGLNRMDLVARYSSLAWLAFLGSTVLFVHRDADAWRIPASLVGAMGLLLLLELRWFVRHHGPVRLRFRGEEILSILGGSWRLGLGNTLQRLSLGYPVILLGFVAGSAAVGDYRIAELVFSFLAQFGHLLATAAFSRISHDFSHRRRAVAGSLSRLLTTLTAVAITAGLLLAFWGPALVGLVLGDGISPASAGVLRVLGLALAFAGPVRFLKALLPGIDRHDLVLPVNAWAVALGLGLGWVLTLRLGVVGMAWTVLLTEAATLAFLLVLYRGALREGGRA